MTEIRQLVVPRSIPALLSFVAGYIDSLTFLGLFGIFVAQMTGSYVLTGTNFVAPEHGLTVKLLAIPAFFLGGCVAAAVAAIASGRGWRPLACVMGLECALLSAFTAVLLLGSLPNIDAPAVWSAALLGLAAMGVQSAMVRLLMRGVLSTNVMTTNTSQIAVDCTLVLLERVMRRSGILSASSARLALDRLSGALPIVASFLFGTLCGAFAFSIASFATVLVPVGVAFGVFGWAMRIPNQSSSAPEAI
jgi:uncharacterized membrane protein YoaK (UPF0700 family)